MPKGEKMTSVTIRVPEALKRELDGIQVEINQNPQKYPDLVAYGNITRGAALRYVLLMGLKQIRKSEKK